MQTLSRYIVTERIEASHPTLDDPKAQAFKRFSGVFDIRDSQSGNVICASSSRLSVLRKVQAKWNTAELTMH